ncbi:hypothetical protein SDC9_201076 [bioreactor metagenome]|uniref:Uncharacterized protein n=1 Tax=bioreactor metagenome TaxID=1076179 RepID=A0A645IR89_9ZZZZ
MEGRDPHQPGPVADQLLHPVPHLGGGLVGEGDRQYRTGMDVPDAHQVRDPAGQHPSLARPGTGHHQHRAAGVQHRFSLRRVQIGDQLILGHLVAAGPLGRSVEAGQESVSHGRPSVRQQIGTSLQGHPTPQASYASPTLSRWRQVNRRPVDRHFTSSDCPA